MFYFVSCHHSAQHFLLLPLLSMSFRNSYGRYFLEPLLFYFLFENFKLFFSKATLKLFCRREVMTVFLQLIFFHFMFMFVFEIKWLNRVLFNQLLWESWFQTSLFWFWYHSKHFQEEEHIYRFKTPHIFLN